MRNLLKHFLAFHAAIAYLSMLTGFGMLVFTYAFFYLLSHDIGVSTITHWALTYLMLVIGPGAIIVALSFYQKTQRVHNK